MEVVNAQEAIQRGVEETAKVRRHDTAGERPSSRPSPPIGGGEALARLPQRISLLDGPEVEQRSLAVYDALA